DKMGNNDFSSGFSVNMNPGEAIRKISHVPEWWGINFTGSADKEKDRFTVTMGGDSFFDFTVTELVPDKRVVWLVEDCHMPWYADKKECAHTRLIFDVRKNLGVKKMTLANECLTPIVECYRDCDRGWTICIKTSLYSYLTT